ncbi:MAG: hypothetical protein GTO02_06210 [Candidatus Dadabacteria bacterium]|nr:hypothetical protein [Candidatus Dadabacteria bacterium]NIQ13994.1 hypothetical protein [Candidatus Dadabacteria bacterium]
MKISKQNILISILILFGFLALSNSNTNSDISLKNYEICKFLEHNVTNILPEDILRNGTNKKYIQLSSDHNILNEYFYKLINRNEYSENKLKDGLTQINGNYFVVKSLKDKKLSGRSPPKII